MFAFIHETCGKPAFLYDHMPVAGEIVKSKHALTLDGSPIKPCSVRLCGSCGKIVQGNGITGWLLIAALVQAEHPCKRSN